MTWDVIHSLRVHRIKNRKALRIYKSHFFFPSKYRYDTLSFVTTGTSRTKMLYREQNGSAYDREMKWVRSRSRGYFRPPGDIFLITEARHFHYHQTICRRNRRPNRPELSTACCYTARDGQSRIIIPTTVYHAVI